MPTKRKFVKESTQESPYSKRSRRTRPNQTEIAEKILDIIKSHQQSDGTFIANSFLKVPSKRQNPEYHETVNEPIDLTRINQRLRMDEYRDIESLTADIELLVSNTKKFYEDESQEFQDANALWELYLDTKSTVLSTDAPEEQGGEEIFNKLDDIYNSLLAEVDDEGQGITDMFMVLPDMNVYPDYYQKIKEPIDLKTIGEKIQNKEYRTLQDFDKDMKQLIRNAKVYNEPNSKIYNHAVALKKALQETIIAEQGQPEKPEVAGTKTSARIKQRYSAKFDGDGILKRQDAVDFPETSIRSSRSAPMLQASITDTSLKGKDGLQAKLYNEVVNFRNHLGHSISDAFVRLPNKHHYPAYYDEIENPISLKTIRRQILSSKYKRVERLAEDFQLLFRNAMQYNKEGSQIYKNAKMLQDVVEAKLESYLKLEDDLEISDDTSEDEDASDDDKDDDEEEEEEEEEDSEEEDTASVSTEGKKVRKRRSDFGVSRRVRTLSIKGKAKSTQDLFRERLRTLYDAVLNAVDGDRPMIVLFMEKPSRKDYPDYYKLILEPIDMKMIDKKIRQDKYPTVESMIEDFHLMFTNARHYNEPGSQVYQDADRLQEILIKKHGELSHLFSSEIGQTSGKSDTLVQQMMNPLMKNMEQVYQRVRGHRDITGREICEIFNRLPSKHELPDYYQIIKKPMDSDKILQKMQTNVYSTINEFMADVLLMFENACLYNEPGSVIYKDALILQKVAVDTCNEVAGVTQAPDVQRFVQEMLTSLFVSVVNHQDEDGRCYSDSLMTPPLKTEPVPQADPSSSGQTMEIDAAAQSISEERKLTLESIRRNLHAKRYRRLDVFQQHMFEVFDAVRKSNRTDCELYEDAVELQRFFIRIRDELCKNGEILMSPANAFTAKRFQLELDAEKQAKLPAEAMEDEEVKEEGKEMREKVQRSASSEGMDYKGVTYKPGDFVYVEDTAEVSSGHPPHIVCIEKLYQDETGEQRMYGVWFFRPQDTYHLQSRKFLVNEVFKSDYYNTVPVSSIRGKCFVMMVKDYFKHKPVGYSDDDVYVCVSRYSSRMKSFKRIKLLNLPANNTKIVQREKPLVPVRVSSVYSENIKDPMEAAKISDLRGQLVTDELPWPSDIIDRERKNIAIENNMTDSKLTVQQTFYLQYIINSLCLKVSDNVYVRQLGTDERLKIARIESMWSDANGQMWFQGSWFAQPGETEHEPTRMFYKNEVFLLSFNSPSGDEATASMPPPTPLSWVVGVCSVLSVREAAQCRPTEIPEMHIHVCESRYLAADKIIKKIKGALKKPPVHHKVVDDEYYYFKKPLEIPKEVSPQLITAVRQEIAEREEDFAKEQEENRRKALQVQAPPGMMVGQAYPQAINPMMQPGNQRQIAMQQYPQYQQPLQQHPYQLQQQQYVTQPSQQQYIASPNQPQQVAQGVPMQQQYVQHQYSLGTPYTPHPQMQGSHQVMLPGSSGHPIQANAQPQVQQAYPGMQPPHAYATGQMAQSPLQSNVRQTNTPIDRVETPGSSGSGTPTTTKKKNRGGHSTGYILFASQCHPRMRAENPTMPFGDISKLVGEEWRNQPDEKKREYEEKARELSAKAEAEGRPMQGKKKKKQQMRREMEEAAQQQQQLQQQQQHPPPQPHVVMQQQQIGAPVILQQHAYSQPQYQTGQFPPPQQAYQPAMPETPQHAQLQQFPIPPAQLSSTPAGSVTVQPTAQTYLTPAAAPQASTSQPTAGPRRGPLFVKPPPKVQRVLHSEAYLRYIESLEKGNRTISNFEKTVTVEEKDVQLSQAEMSKLPVHWLANGKGKHESVKSALWALRDLMLKDALAVKNHFVH